MRGSPSAPIKFKSYPNKWDGVITNSQGHGFVGSSSSGFESYYILVDGLKICNNTNVGTAGWRYWTWTNCWVKANGAQGISFSSAGSASNIVANCLVEGNGWNNPSDPTHYHGIYPSGPGHRIFGNVVRYNTGAGIHGYTEDVGTLNWDSWVFQNKTYGNTNLYGFVWWNGNEDSGGSHLLGTNYAFSNTFLDGVQTSYGTLYLSNNIIQPHPTLNPTVPVNQGGAPRAPTVVGNYNLSTQTINPNGANDVHPATVAAIGFVSTNQGLLWLTASSPARNVAHSSPAGPVDWFGNTQSSVTDIGAVQYSAALAADVRTLDPSPANPDYWAVLTLSGRPSRSSAITRRR
jgi:hypothetical protein